MDDRQSLTSLVDDFERLSTQTAVVSPHGLRHPRTSYGELATLARRFAAELVHRGINKGDRVLIWGDNSAEWVATFFGCMLRSVLPVPVDVASTPDFAQRVEHEVSPKLIVGDETRVKTLAPAAPAIYFERFAETISAELGCAVAGLQETDALQIVFTSGTTGEPKGIVHTHKNVLASLRPIESEAKKYLKYEWLVHPIRILHTLPLSHVFGQFLGLWVPPLIRAEVHYQQRLVAADLVERIHKERISVLAAVPRVLELLQHYLEECFPDLLTRIERARNMKAWQRWWYFRDVHRLFGLKFWAVVCGGASLAPGAEQFWNALGFVVIQGYGMTETTALVSLNHPFRPAQGTIGQVLPGREVRLSDDGEVLVRGDTISNAMWEAGQLRRVDSEWLATGDLAEFDESGNLRFRGRKKDVIVTSSGLNIYPEDLEAALNRQPGVKACAVVERSGEHGPEPVAAIVLNGEGNATNAVTSANRELAEFQQIRRWIVWPEPDLPRTSTGKVLRREVSRRIAIGETSSSEWLESGRELDLDSLARVELQARLEQQYGVSLDDAALQDVKTGEDVRKLITHSPLATTSEPIERAGHAYPHWPWNPFMQAVRTVFLEVIAMPLLRFLAKPRVASAVEHWPSTPMFIVCNHITAYDPAFVLYALPRRIRHRVVIAMAGEMLLDFRQRRNQENWFLNLVVPVAYLLVTGLFNVFPLPQLSGFRRSFQHAGEAVDRGYSVMVFPEGRRSDDERTLPFKSGAGLLWKELGIPALPVRLRGVGEIKAQHARWFRTDRISVEVGEVLALDVNKSAQELTQLLRDAVLSEPAGERTAEANAARSR